MATTQIVTDERQYEAFPMDRPTEQVIAERMLAAALHNYHRVFAGKASVGEMKTWYDLSDTQRAFLLDFAIPAAMRAVWRGR